jgi:hypothetical protein
LEATTIRVHDEVKGVPSNYNLGLKEQIVHNNLTIYSFNVK